MKNSEDPRTTEFAEKMAELTDAPPVFRNLDVVRTEGDVAALRGSIARSGVPSPRHPSGAGTEPSGHHRVSGAA